MRQIQTTDDWRDHGKVRRRHLLEKDALEGSMNFSLSEDCSVSMYFKVADRVLEQFCSMYKNRTNMEEMYVRGHRLVVFLNSALPEHPEYDSLDPEISFMRQKSQTDLDWILNRLDIVALRIDEEQLNNHLMGIKRENLQQRQKTETEWESFSGWAPFAGEDREWEDGIVSFQSSESDRSTSSSDMSIEHCIFPDMTNEKPFSTASHDPFRNDNSLSDDSISVIEEDEERNFLRKNTNVSDTDQQIEDSSQRRVILNIVNDGAVEPRVDTAEDPPGLTMSFSRDKSFSPEKQAKEEVKPDRKDVVVSPIDVRHDFEKRQDMTIRSVPSDESDIPPRRRVRFNEAGNQTKVYVPGERVTAIW
mmetsp:Transcript_32730/g.49325  ORF Transcript_32730/g.49325 Transcript_32730/m.49325 type:complete len:361 (+) Transcript_32730:45-1127(+)